MPVDSGEILAVVAVLQSDAQELAKWLKTLDSGSGEDRPVVSLSKGSNDGVKESGVWRIP